MAKTSSVDFIYQYFYNRFFFFCGLQFFSFFHTGQLRKGRTKKLILILKKRERYLDRIGQKLRNIKGIKLRIGKIETKDNANKKIKMKMIR